MSTAADDLNHIEDWQAESSDSITARLNGANASQSQTRLTLGVMVLVSLMMLITTYNAYFSYDYNWLITKRSEAIDEKTEVGVLRAQALKDFAAARIVQVTLLGIRVSVDDAAVVGTAILMILSMWLLLVTRRENYTIGFLLRDTDSSGPDAYTEEQRWRIFHSILANSVLLTLNHSLSRFQSLQQRGYTIESERSPWANKMNRWSFMLVRGFFFMFPVVTAVLVFAVDRWSYFIPDPFEPDAQQPQLIAFYWRSMIVFFVCWIPLMLCCWRSRQFLVATEKILQEYGAKMRKELSARRRTLPPQQLLQ